MSEQLDLEALEQDLAEAGCLARCVDVGRLLARVRELEAALRTVKEQGRPALPCQGFGCPYCTASAALGARP